MARKPLNQKKSEAIAKLEAAKAEIEKIERAEAERIGKLAIKAGLTDIDITDVQLLKAFKDIAARFQDNPAAEKSVQSHQSTTVNSSFGNGTSTHEGS